MNILALQRRRAGDILMTTPALRALKRRFPQAEVTYVCERPYTALLHSNRNIDTLLPSDAGAGIVERLRLLATLRERKFDLALDFEGSPWTAALTAGSGAARRIGFRSGLRGFAYSDRVELTASGGYVAAEKLALLGPLGIELRALNQRPELEVERPAREWVRRTLEAAGIGSSEFLLTVSPGGRSPESCWPLERYARLLDALASSHAFETILVPWPADHRVGADLARLTAVPLFQLDKDPSLSQLAALLDRADLHVGNENAVTHMAAALGTSTLALYAPGRRRRWGIPGDPLQVGLEPPLGASPDGPYAAETAGRPQEEPAVPRAYAEGSSPALVITEPPIGRIKAEEAYAALLRLEGYLPRLRSARRPSGIRDAAPSTPSDGSAPDMAASAGGG